jgi:hypothetical protein
MRQNKILPSRAATCITLIILVWGYDCLAVQRREHRYSVRGRVVDSNGKPVPGAIIYLDPIPGADQIFGDTTDENGKFHLSESSNIPRKLRRLYVTSPPPSHGAILIAPPYNLLPRLVGPSFAGKRVLMRQRDMDVGNVEVQVRYGLIDIRVRDCQSQPLIAKPEQWRYVYFRLRDQHNRIITDSTLSYDDILKSVDFANSTITLALPEGIWRLDVSVHGYNGPWSTSSDAIVIKSDTRGYLILRSCENS